MRRKEKDTKVKVRAKAREKERRESLCCSSWKNELSSSS